MRDFNTSTACLAVRLCPLTSAEGLCLSVTSTLRSVRGYASPSVRHSLTALSTINASERQSLSALGCGRAAIVLVILLLTTHCSLLTIFAQPGVPQPNSPLYGGGMNQGQTSVGLPPALKKVGIDQRLNEQLPLDAVFKDEQGNEVRLGQFFNGKPVVIALVYYPCPMLCNQVLNGMLGSFRQISFNAGEQFEVVTVSFDTRETPQLAAAKKETYIKGYNRANGAAGRHFLTGDDANVKRLTEAVGFSYTV